MKRAFIFVLALAICLSLLPSSVEQIYAKKKIVRLTKTGTAAVSNRLVIKPKLRSDRKALIINFSNLAAVSSFTYELNYIGSGVAQGVAGSITPRGESNLQRELLFATCSKNVCRYQTDIKNMKLTITSTLTSGLKVRKSFKIKV